MVPVLGRGREGGKSGGAEKKGSRTLFAFCLCVCPSTRTGMVLLYLNCVVGRAGWRTGIILDGAMRGVINNCARNCLTSVLVKRTAIAFTKVLRP